MTPTFFADRDLGITFPQILNEAGIPVERHADHFPPDAADQEWLALCGAEGWYALTRDRDIRYKPNEKAAVFKGGVGMFVIVGKAKHRDLAENFVRTIPRILTFIETTGRPFIAKVYRPAPLGRRPGRVEMWLHPNAKW